MDSIEELIEITNKSISKRKDPLAMVFSPCAFCDYANQRLRGNHTTPCEVCLIDHHICDANGKR
jgi:hypothetical protein